MKIDKKVILANLPFLFIFWLADKLAYSYRINEGKARLRQAQKERGERREPKKPPKHSPPER